MSKKKILFVGASGEVAKLVLPELASSYDIVGITKTRKDLHEHCVDVIVGDLLREHSAMFASISERHEISAIVWNAVQYFPSPILRASRNSLHVEFDLAVALPLECLRVAVAAAKSHPLTFVMVTSQLAFGTKSGWGSYGIVKGGQVTLMRYLEEEHAPSTLIPRALALGSVSSMATGVLVEAFINTLVDPLSVPLVQKVG